MLRLFIFSLHLFIFGYLLLKSSGKCQAFYRKLRGLCWLTLVLCSSRFGEGCVTKAMNMKMNVS